MIHAMPSLISLRAFEAAARLGSFKQAAEELSVTPTAVSHHIRGLEDALDIQLFVRETRAVRLTDTGKQLAGRLTIAFTEISDALADVQVSEHVLTVTTTPAFGALWLAPRLEDFQKAYPDITLRLETGTAPVDLMRDRRIDLAIRYGGRDGPLVAGTLPTERIGLFGSEKLVTELAGRIDDATILCTEWEQPDLAPVRPDEWFQAAGFEGKAVIRKFGQEHHVVQCAVAGQGLALLSEVLADDLVARGLLDQFRPDVTVPGRPYTILCLPERRRVRKIARFIEWLEHGLSSPARETATDRLQAVSP